MLIGSVDNRVPLIIFTREMGWLVQCTWVVCKKLQDVTFSVFVIWCDLMKYKDLCKMFEHRISGSMVRTYALCYGIRRVKRSLTPLLKLTTEVSRNNGVPSSRYKSVVICWFNDPNLGTKSITLHRFKTSMCIKSWSNFT